MVFSEFFERSDVLFAARQEWDIKGSERTRTDQEKLHLNCKKGYDPIITTIKG